MNFNAKDILLDGGLIYGFKTINNPGSDLINKDLAISAGAVSIGHNVVTKKIARDLVTKVSKMDNALVNGVIGDTLSIGGLKLAMDQFYFKYPEMNFKDALVYSAVVVGGRYIIDKY